ncbi:fungal-specific transcription factor domain-containing protein [Hyaloscypha sp. PMI_1271]|nr:fungal-specific transcription factor domain-containing protein [Hyaloscypha sp. PMI_1271]
MHHFDALSISGGILHVIRRHGHSNAKLAILASSVVGKKATSCNQCAHTKKRCDRKFPCSNCATKSFSCTYERQSSASSRTSPTILQTTHSFGEEDQSVPDLEVNYDFADDLNLSIPFSLQHSTDPDWQDLDWNAEFPLQVSEDSSIHNEVHSQNVGQGSGYGQFEPSYSPPSTPEGNNKNFKPSFDFLLNFTHQSGLKSVFNYKRCRLPPTTTNHDFYQLSHHHGVSSEAVIARTQESCCSFRTSDSSGMPPYRDQHRNLRKFTHLFWDEWYPHCPILHKPTFDLACAPVMLLVPMAIIGACMSPKDEEVGLAKEWLEFGEEIVFSSALLSAEPVERATSETDIPPLRIIQAAYITCILLNWEGNDTMKRRVRHHHFAAVVSAVREIGLATSNHYPLDFTDESNFSWQNFIEREEVIRTFTYVFLLDTAFVIFNNTPPRMVLHEMNLEMPTPEPCFQADNAKDCYSRWHTNISQHFAIPGSMPLLQGEAISILMRDTYDEHSPRFAHLSILSLFTLVAVFQQRSLFTCLPTSLVPVRSALARWQALWPMRSDGVDNTVERESWQDTGFIGQAQEFAWLVIARLDKLETPSEAVPATASEQTPLVESASGRLDDTSMTVVTDLMLSLTVTS